MKTIPMRTSKGYLFRICYTRKSAPISYIWWPLKGKQGSRKALEWRKGRLQVGLTGGCWPGKLEAGSLEAGHPL